MRGIGVEVRAAVLEDHAGARRHHTGAESPEEALNDGEDIAPSVRHHEAGGVAVDVAPGMVLGLLGIERRAPAPRIRLGEKLLERRAGMRGIGYPSITV